MEISVIFKAKHELMCSEKTLISDISTWYQNYLGSSRDNLVTFSYTKHFYCCEKNRKKYQNTKQFDCLIADCSISASL